MTLRSINMTAGRTASALATRALMDYALSRGCSLRMLTERAGIQPAELRDPEKRIAFTRYAALMAAAKELCDDPALALHFGESDEGMEATFACMMGIFSPTMAETLAQDAGADDELQLKRKGDEVWIIDPRNDDFPEGPEASFARSICAARRLFSGSEFVKAVHFKHSEPPYRAEYDRIFGVPVSFDAPHNAVVLSADWFTLKPPSPSREVLQIMTARAERMLSARKRVEAVLTNAFPAGDANVAVVASQLGMSRHTLFRKLRAEGVTFKRVVDELRRDLATKYLCDRKLAVNETAYLLGFSDSTAFSRAYKRWTGRSPRHAGEDLS